MNLAWRVTFIRRTGDSVTKVLACLTIVCALVGTAACASRNEPPEAVRASGSDSDSCDPSQKGNEKLLACFTTWCEADDNDCPEQNEPSAPATTSDVAGRKFLKSVTGRWGQEDDYRETGDWRKKAVEEPALVTIHEDGRIEIAKPHPCQGQFTATKHSLYSPALDCGRLGTHEVTILKEPGPAPAADRLGIAGLPGVLGMDPAFFDRAPG